MNSKRLWYKKEIISLIKVQKTLEEYPIYHYYDDIADLIGTQDSVNLSLMKEGFNALNFTLKEISSQLTNADNILCGLSLVDIAGLKESEPLEPHLYISVDKSKEFKYSSFRTDFNLVELFPFLKGHDLKFFNEYDVVMQEYADIVRVIFFKKNHLLSPQKSKDLNN